MPRNKEERDYVDNNRRIINRDKKKKRRNLIRKKILIRCKFENGGNYGNFFILVTVNFSILFIMEVCTMYLYIYYLLVIFLWNIKINDENLIKKKNISKDCSKNT